MIIEAVRKNKIKTFFIAVLFFIFIFLFICSLSYFFMGGFSEFIIIFAAASAIITSLISYYQSDKIVLSLSNARVATREEFLQLNNILEGLCLGAGLPMPKLYVMDDSAMNAFATGRNPEHSVICVTTGLLNRLDKNEIEGVLAHELSHIKNYDVLLQTVAVVMVGFVVIIADIVSRSIHRSGDDDNKASAIIMLLSFIFIIIAPIFGELLKLLLSRNREYLADASAVELTRNNEGLISALRKITEDTEALEQAHKSTESLYIINPLVTEKKKKTSIWSTHPSTDDRIERLINIH